MLNLGKHHTQKFYLVHYQKNILRRLEAEELQKKHTGEGTRS
jgi:hypothetical protein